MERSIVVVAVASIGFGLFFTWLGRLLAPRFGLVDRPDGRRKIHAAPIAVVGGVALLLAAVSAVVTVAFFSDSVASALWEHRQPMLCLGIAAAIIAVVGLVDDVYNLRARHKLLGQFTAIGILIVPGGFEIEQISVFGQLIHLDWLSIPITGLWFLAAINALNLLDGMDGMLGIIGTIVLVTLSLMAFSLGHGIDGYIAIALAGGLIGFLRFNLPPATVYLGDCGSMLVGLCIAAMAIHASLKGPAVAVAVPMALLVLPFLDTAAAIVRRKLTGRGIAAADRGHLHHILQKRGLAKPRILVLVAVLCIVASLGAFGSMHFHLDYLAVASALVIMLILVIGGLFGAAELRLIRERLRSVLRVARGGGIQMEVRLQGSADWTEVWQQITETAEEHRFLSVTLDLNAPAWHEGYHRRWTRVGIAEDPLTGWSVDLPLISHGQIIGRLTVTGNREREGESLVEMLTAMGRILAQTEVLAGQAAQRTGVVQRVPSSTPSIPLGAGV